MQYLIILLTSLFMIFTSGCSQVESGETGIKTKFGAVQGEPLQPGIHFYFPFIYSIYVMDTKVHTVEEDSSAQSHDLQPVKTVLTVNYHLGKENPKEHFIRVGFDLAKAQNEIVKPAITETFKAVVSEFDAQDLITRRTDVSNKIEKLLASKLSQYDFYIDSISVTNFQFSKDFTAAIEEKQIAQQKALKATNDLERIKVEAKQQIVEAEAKAKSMEIQKSVATEELLKLKSLEIKKEMVDKWDGKLPSTNFGSNPLNLIFGK